MQPLPSVAQNFGNPILTGTRFGPKSIPLLARLHKKGTLYGTTVVCIIVGAYRRKFGQFSEIFDILHSPWHNHWKNHTLSGTHLVFKILPLVALKLAKMVPLPP